MAMLHVAFDLWNWPATMRWRKWYIVETPRLIFPNHYEMAELFTLLSNYYSKPFEVWGYSGPALMYIVCVCETTWPLEAIESSNEFLDSPNIIRCSFFYHKIHFTILEAMRRNSKRLLWENFSVTAVWRMDIKQKFELKLSS